MKSLFDEENKLKLIDLTGRLPYGVIVNTPKGDGYLHTVNLTIFGTEYGVNIDATKRDTFNDREDVIKPYLRPMSSMTEEENEEYNNIDNRAYFCPKDYAHIPAKDRIDWLLKNHFDFRGLIPKGLAIEVAKENNPYEIRSRE